MVKGSLPFVYVGGEGPRKVVERRGGGTWGPGHLHDVAQSPAPKFLLRTVL